MRLQLQPTQVTRAVHAPFMMKSSRRRNGSISPFSASDSYRICCVSTLFDESIMTQSAGTLSPAFKITMSPTNNLEMSRVQVQPAFPRYTGSYSSAIIDCNLTNFLSLAQSFRLVIRTRIKIDAQTDTPSIQPVWTLQIIPEIKLSVAQMARYIKIFSLMALHKEALYKGSSTAIFLFSPNLKNITLMAYFSKRRLRSRSSPLIPV